MTDLDAAVDLIKQREGCRLVAYQDIVGIWTIGYGETLDVHAGMVWTQEQADEAIRRRVLQFMVRVMKLCPTLAGSRLVACTSLAYNIGLGGFSASSVRRYANRGEHSSAAQSFMLWDKAGGRRIRGLTVRRDIERCLYLAATA